MRFVYAFLVVLVCFIPVLIGAGFGLEALIGYCKSNKTCSSVEVCSDSKCKDPCDHTKCGHNARCVAFNHAATCECLPHYRGDPTWGCEKKCRHDGDCGIHATCHKFNYGVALCKCEDKYVGDPWNKCEKSCIEDKECDDREVCSEKKCVDACTDMLCGKNAQCRSSGHNAVCKCKPCFRGNPYLECTERNSDECKGAE